MSGRFIPEIFARRGEGSDESDGEDSEEGFTGTAQKKRKALVETDKGALFHKYDKSVHEWVTHLRRVHPELPALDMDLTLDGKPTKVAVKACNPLAPPGVPLYYYHSRTPYYNDKFFLWWDRCFSEAVRHVCPWMVVSSKKSLEKLLSLKITR